jgi:integrase
MATYKQRGERHQFQIYVNGVRESRTFANKKEGQAWAARREAELFATGLSGLSCRYSVAQMFDKYIEEVAPKHGGARNEIIRLRAFKKNRELPMDVPVSQILRQDIKQWRAVRLRQISEASVQREMNLLTSVFEAARSEWGWIETNPTRGIKKLPTPEHRTSVWKYSEMKAVLRALRYSPLSSQVESTTQSVALAFLLALRTGMRAGELCSMTWENTQAYSVTLPTTKNGSVRHVPLDYRARRIIERARGWDAVSVFNLKTRTLDALFRRAKAQAGLRDANVRFHDSRHTAATWLAKDLSMVDLCKMFGWKNPQYALIYYNPDAQDMARHLDSRRLQGALRSNLDQRFSGGRNRPPIQ